MLERPSVGNCNAIRTNISFIFHFIAKITFIAGKGALRLRPGWTAMRPSGHAFMTVALTLRSRFSMVVILCSFSANLTMVLQVSREVFTSSAVFKLAPHDPIGLRILCRLESQMKKVMTNWELETAVSSPYLNHALRFRHVHLRPANILRTRTVLHFSIFCF